MNIQNLYRAAGSFVTGRYWFRSLDERYFGEQRPQIELRLEDSTGSITAIVEADSKLPLREIPPARRFVEVTGRPRWGLDGLVLEVHSIVTVEAEVIRASSTLLINQDVVDLLDARSDRSGVCLRADRTLSRSTSIHPVPVGYIVPTGQPLAPR